MKKLLLGATLLLLGQVVQTQALRIFNYTPCTFRVTVWTASPTICALTGAPAISVTVPYTPGPGLSFPWTGQEWRYATIVDDGAFRCGPSGSCTGDLGTYLGVSAPTTSCTHPHKNCVNVGSCNSTCPRGTNYSLYYSQNFSSSGPTDIEIY